MKENFLHYLWKYKKFAFAKAYTTSNQKIHIQSTGQHNHHAGPDFFNASVQIGEQLWAGNVEIHKKSSDWYAHGHEGDPAYDSVILHVVWEHDIDIYRKDNTPIPTLVLKSFVSDESLKGYHSLFMQQSNKWINCENDFGSVPNYIIDSWLDRLFFERLEMKSNSIAKHLKKTNGDWEKVLFILIMRAFGTKVNASSFEALAQGIDYTIIKKNTETPFALEALLMGTGGVLPVETIESYPLQLLSEYSYLEKKYSSLSMCNMPLQFYGLRPANFPTIRLSQVAQLFHKQPRLFQSLMGVQSLDEIYKCFDITASPYWDTHYNFGKSHGKRSKKLTKSFIDLIILNTILPLRFYYARSKGKDESVLILQLIQELAPEKNSLIKKFGQIGKTANNALESQSLIHLKTTYCDAQKCLSCAVGNHLLSNT